MSLHAPSLSAINGASFSVGIAAARFNERYVDALLHAVTVHLDRAGVRARRIHVIRVPGSHELPSAVQMLCVRHRPDVCLALGVIIRGQTLHYDLVARAAGQGLMRVALDARIPVINGVIVAGSRPQAEARCCGRIQRGTEFAQAALVMAGLKRKLAP